MLLAITNFVDSTKTTAATDTFKHAVNLAKDSVKTLNNITLDLSNIEKGNGILITVVGLLVVFFALALLSFFFILLSKALKVNLKKKRIEKGEIKDDTVEEDRSGEIDAAISLALHLYFSEIHDQEAAVLTINRVQRTYSPWSSKIYGLRNYPRK